MSLIATYTHGPVSIQANSDQVSALADIDGDTLERAAESAAWDMGLPEIDFVAASNAFMAALIVNGDTYSVLLDTLEDI